MALTKVVVALTKLLTHALHEIIILLMYKKWVRLWCLDPLGSFAHWLTQNELGSKSLGVTCREAPGSSVSYGGARRSRMAQALFALKLWILPPDAAYRMTGGSVACKFKPDQYLYCMKDLYKASMSIMGRLLLLNLAHIHGLQVPSAKYCFLIRVCRMKI